MYPVRETIRINFHAFVNSMNIFGEILSNFRMFSTALRNPKFVLRNQKFWATKPKKYCCPIPTNIAFLFYLQPLSQFSSKQINATTYKIKRLHKINPIVFAPIGWRRLSIVLCADINTILFEIDSKLS